MKEKKAPEKDMPKKNTEKIIQTTPAILKNFFANQSNFYDINQTDLPPIYSKEEFFEEMHRVDLRNELENRFHAAVVAGDAQLAKELMEAFSSTIQSENIAAYPIPLDPLRVFKMSAISMNAILRKEIERNDIPNIYINHHSSRFSWMIETAESYEEVGRVIEKMVETYAYLSRHYSMAAYSMAVKKTLLYIDSHLSEELNVNQLAAQVSLTPNYLSSLFKKETGVTLTSYILQKRIYHACFLLKDTDMAIGDVAFSVGIKDANYFTKVFKKYTGKTPVAYRKSGAQPPNQ